MAKKDPAFLLYASDFMMGTAFFSNEQVGKYIRLLCAQHQHGGIIDKSSFNSLVGNDELLKSKFIECEYGFYNERLADEMEARNKKSTNISNAAKETWEKRRNDKKSDTIVLQSYNESSGIVIRPEDEDESINYSSTNTIPKMVEIFKKSYPSYFVDEKLDFPAVLQIAYKIAKQKGWSKDSVLNVNSESLLDAWGKIVEFSTADKWYSTRSISDFNTEYQRIVQSMVSANKVSRQQQQKQQESTAPPLTVLKHI